MLRPIEIRIRLEGDLPLTGSEDPWEHSRRPNYANGLPGINPACEVFWKLKTIVFRS